MKFATQISPLLGAHWKEGIVRLEVYNTHFVVISSPHTAYCSQCRGIADGKRLVKYSRKRTNNGNRQVCVVVWGLYCVMHSVSALFLSLFLSFLWFQFIHSFYTFFVCFSFSFFLFFFNLLFLPTFHSPIIVFMFIYLF